MIIDLKRFIDLRWLLDDWCAISQIILFVWNLLLILVGWSLACSDRETESSSGVILAPSLPPSPTVLRSGRDFLDSSGYYLETPTGRHNSQDTLAEREAGSKVIDHGTNFETPAFWHLIETMGIWVNLELTFIVSPQSTLRSQNLNKTFIARIANTFLCQAGCKQ